MSEDKVGQAAREAGTVVGITDTGQEVVMEGLVAGPGHRSTPPPPFSPGWTLLIDAGIASAQAAIPPAESEVRLWEQIRTEGIDLAYVQASTDTGGPRLLPGWQASRRQNSDGVSMEKDITPRVTFTPPETPDLVRALAEKLTALAIQALDLADREIYLAEHVSPIADEKFVLMSPDHWDWVVTRLIETLGEHLDRRALHIRPGLVKRLTGGA